MMMDIDNLIAGYLSRELSREEALRLEEWVAASPENAGYFRQARRLWFSVKNPDADKIYDSRKAFGEFQHKVAAYKKHKHYVHLYSRVAAVAAAVAVIAVSSFMFAKYQHEKAYADIVVEAPSGAQSRVTLPDGSSVWLNAGSKIVYKNAFGRKSREIKLAGEGMFDVVKDSRHPFYVFTDNIVVKVVGTTFTVSDYKNTDSVFVALVKGKVDLMKTDGSDEKVSLDPDDCMSMKVAEGKMVVRHSPEMVSSSTRWTDGQILMEEKYLSEIAGILEKYYGVKVRISDRELYEQRYRAIFFLDEQPLEEVLGALCKASGDKLQYKIQGDTVTVFKK